MKIKHLIEELQKYDPEYFVVLSEDGEGNGFSPLSGMSTGMYIPDTTWRGEVHFDRQDYEDEIYREDADIEPFKENSLVFWPVN